MSIGQKLTFGNVTVPKGIYPGLICEVLEDELQNSQFDPHIYRWYFLIDNDGEILEVQQITSRRLGANSNAGKLIRGILPEIKPGDGFGFADLYNVPCHVNLDREERSGDWYNKVTDVTRMSAKDLKSSEDAIRRLTGRITDVFATKEELPF